jgi:hypothetical protein
MNRAVQPLRHTPWTAPVAPRAGAVSMSATAFYAVHRPRPPSRLLIMSDDGMLTAKSKSAVTFHIDGVPYFRLRGFYILP